MGFGTLQDAEVGPTVNLERCSCRRCGTANADFTIVFPRKKAPRRRYGERMLGLGTVIFRGRILTGPRGAAVLQESFSFHFFNPKLTAKTYRYPIIRRQFMSLQ